MFKPNVFAAVPTSVIVPVVSSSISCPSASEPPVTMQPSAVSGVPSYCFSADSVAIEILRLVTVSVPRTGVIS